MMKAALARTRPALSHSTKKRWHIARKSGQSGPYGDVEFAAQAGDDAIEPGDLVWRPGFLAWVRAEEVPGLLIPPPLPERTARQTDRGEALRLVVTNDRECAAPAAPVASEDRRDEIAPMAEARPEREKAGEASQSPADAAPRPASPQLLAVTGDATTDANPVTANATPAASVAEEAADPMTLDGPNFDRLRALLDVSNQPRPPQRRSLCATTPHCDRSSSSRVPRLVRRDRR